MTASMCGKRYGKRRNLICKRKPNHRGPHGLRARLRDLLS